jgi:Flp pilus assembly CpaF family ATPase
LGALIPGDGRIIAIEDPAQVHLAGGHVVRLETRFATADGLSAVFTP